jgi:hypothetical protein
MPVIHLKIAGMCHDTGWIIMVSEQVVGGLFKKRPCLLLVIFSQNEFVFIDMPGRISGLVGVKVEGGIPPFFEILVVVFWGAEERKHAV